MDSFERTLLVKPEVFVYKIPPRTTTRGYRASDWNLDKPDFVLRLRVLSKDPKCVVRLEDKTSGELFGECPVDTFPGPAIESVSDSSRYFVLRLQDPSGRSAFLGLGFTDRSDSFDLNVALQDYFKGIRTEENIVQEEARDLNKAPLDLAFKEGQMIKINIGKKSSSVTKRPTSDSSFTPGLLPPPPGGSSGPRIIPPPQSAASGPPREAPEPKKPLVSEGSSGLLDFDPLSSNTDGQGDSMLAGKSSSDRSWMGF